jgi:hypothetical protein
VTDDLPEHAVLSGIASTRQDALPKAMHRASTDSQRRSRLFSTVTRHAVVEHSTLTFGQTERIGVTSHRSVPERKQQGSELPQA